MIDNIKIILKDFSGNFSNCVLQPNTNEDGLDLYDNYQLTSLNVRNRAKLEIKHNKSTDIITVTGSLRKWFLGENTLLDLRRISLEKTLFKLGEKLNIPLSELYDASFTQIELGQNVKVGIPVHKLKSGVVKYGSHYENTAYGSYDTTGYFSASKKQFKIYDKLIDISRYNTKDKKYAMRTLRKHNVHFARLEFTLYNKSSRDVNLIRHIEKIGHLVEYYHDLWSYWKKEAKRLIVESRVDVKTNSIKRKDAVLGMWLNRMGYIWLEKYLLGNAKSKTHRGLISKKSRIRGNLIKFMKKYSCSNSYSKESFLADLNTHILRIENRD